MHRVQIDIKYRQGRFGMRCMQNNLKNELTEMDFPARVEQSNGFFRVMVGNYGTLDEATAMEQRLKRAGYQTVIVT